jgi:hypothetical protein
MSAFALSATVAHWLKLARHFGQRWRSTRATIALTFLAYFAVGAVLTTDLGMSHQYRVGLEFRPMSYDGSSPPFSGIAHHARVCVLTELVKSPATRRRVISELRGQGIDAINGRPLTFRLLDQHLQIEPMND